MAHDDSRPVPDGGAGATEASPLLDEHTERPAVVVADSYRRRVIIVTFAMFFFLEFGAGLYLPGQTAALEQKICDKIFPLLDPADRDCKAPAVQGELAELQGWRTMLDCIPSTLSTTTGNSRNADVGLDMEPQLEFMIVLRQSRSSHLEVAYRLF